MKIPRLGVEWELPLSIHSKATAIPDLSCTCHLHLSLQQCQILNPLNEARDQTCILMDTRQFLNPLSHNGNSGWCCFNLMMIYSLLDSGFNWQFWKHSYLAKMTQPECPELIMRKWGDLSRSETHVIIYDHFALSQKTSILLHMFKEPFICKHLKFCMIFVSLLL